MIQYSRARRQATIPLWAAVLATVVSADSMAETPAEELQRANLPGGLIVSIGCTSSGDVAGLPLNDRFLVQGLSADRQRVVAIRDQLQRLNRLGPVTVDWFDGATLPFTDNLVNVVMITQRIDDARKSDALLQEVQRVLAPGGILILRKAGNETLLRQVAFAPIAMGDEFVHVKKPVPPEIDEWPHYLHGADNNAVSQDKVVAPPRRLQWQCGPRWSRSHETDMSMSGAVSSGGRLFYFMDEGPIGIHETPETTRRLPDRFTLVCRDAFNGIELWKRPVPNWGSRAWDSRRQSRWGVRDQLWSSPSTLPRRLVAVDDSLFVTLGFDAAVSQLDARTGKTVREFTQLGSAEEILFLDGKLVLRLSSSAHGDATSDFESIAVVDAASGQVLWRRSARRLTNLTLAAANGRICYHDGQDVVALELAAGDELWRRPLKENRKLGGYSLVIYDDVVVLASANGPATATAFSVEDGNLLWQQNVGRSSFRGPVDIFGAKGMLWMGTLSTCGVDPGTGDIAKEIDASNLFTAGHHARCYRARCTERFLLWSKRGIEFLDLEGDQHSRNDWVRGTCRFGIMPANGLIYAPPTPCFCYPGVKLNGFNALAPAASASYTKQVVDASDRLQRGPAFDRPAGPSQNVSDSGDWPTYRHDNARSGATSVAVPTRLGQSWSVQVGRQCTPPVLANQRLYVADKETQSVYCLDAESGQPCWHFVAGGVIDSPPAICGKRIVFGCADGSVYCLHAADGELMWRFRAAPRDQSMVSYGRLQSSWPVHGSVLVRNGVVYFAAGRSSFIDGGVYLYGLDIATGAARYENHLDGPWHSAANKSPHGAHWMDGARNDIMVCENDKLYMLQNVFDLELRQLEAPVTAMHGARKMDRHLIASNGFLDSTGFDRVYWMYAALWPGLYFGHAAPKTGQILVFSDTTVFALHTFSQFFARSPYFVPGRAGYDLVADKIDNEPILTPEAARRERQPGYSRAQPPLWHVKVPIWARAMTLADDRLFLAGPPDEVDPADPLKTFEGRGGAVLRAVNTADGSTLAEYTLEAQPVFDGMIAAGGRLYLTLRDGSVCCWGE